MAHGVKFLFDPEAYSADPVVKGLTAEFGLPGWMVLLKLWGAIVRQKEWWRFKAEIPLGAIAFDLFVDSGKIRNILDSLEIDKPGTIVYSENGRSITAYCPSLYEHIGSYFQGQAAKRHGIAIKSKSDIPATFRNILELSGIFRTNPESLFIEQEQEQEEEKSAREARLPSGNSKKGKEEADSRKPTADVEAVKTDSDIRKALAKFGKPPRNAKEWEIWRFIAEGIAEGHWTRNDALDALDSWSGKRSWNFITGDMPGQVKRIKGLTNSGEVRHNNPGYKLQ